MTLENAKRLYKHYIDNNMLEEAEDIAKHRPELKQSTPKKEESKESKK